MSIESDEDFLTPEEIDLIYQHTALYRTALELAQKRIAELEASEQKWIDAALKWKQRAIELLPKEEQKP